MSVIEDSSDSYDIDFNFVRFIKFLRDNNIIAVAIASVLSDRINEVTNSFTSNIVMPIINRDGDNDGKKDITKLETKSIKFYGMNFAVGKFVVALFKFLIVTYIIFLLSNILKKFVKKVR